MPRAASSEMKHQRAIGFVFLFFLQSRINSGGDGPSNAGSAEDDEDREILNGLVAKKNERIRWEVKKNASLTNLYPGFFLIIFCFRELEEKVAALEAANRAKEEALENKEKAIK